MSEPVEWFKRRRYLHFDLPTSESAAVAIAGNPSIVARHAFYPFIQFTAKSRKVKWDKLTKRLVTTEKERPVSYASHVDSHIYACYASILSQRYEDYLKEVGYQSSVLAFRKLGKSNIEFAKDAFDAIKEMGGADVIAADISDFFGSLNHKILKASWAKILKTNKLPDDHYNVFKSLTRFTWVDKTNLYKALGISIYNPRNSGARICTPEIFRSVVRKLGLIQRNAADKGIPQGSPISALLSNIYMTDFDQALWTAIASMGGKYFRYCDDMLIIAPEGKGKEFMQLARELADLYALPLHPKKTEERFFTSDSGKLLADKPLQYLGFVFDGQQVSLRSASLARYSDRMRRGVRLARVTMHARNTLRVERGESPRPLYKGKLYRRYSYLGRRNFVSYAIRAANILDEKAIKRQVKPLWKRLRSQMK
ncbi:antiviral reverse transcriptase Drt2 [Burkholderia cenocepacia]|uniref:antiviral reverse transcriptase Drt2 n=1 Tax=Burkholderia cenocepacia TaxID=95486 RepID=UPI002B23F25B|nr:antiviral reverse transcriptase Drt2 [Burkholderia cenocepacia]MEB2498544.1 antiviral reverse transcriptase Drt2 [Burkholderia cenocepacia]MEB2554192.1 antiviral reverse transcriptase Drt2 [Burkholderia cenocepacia]